ncbi:NUDIX domain-containing protein [Lysinibacillus sp. 2017]|uniref:NUDIX hydrolase n=1 Tax=unclassified Lysinibacillus TaxID=2636778 RepID=UPI000D52623B|nr:MULTISPECIES: NUDIX domain-containing protein [unclassified Lysinibacillus]AWE09031.1 NUDIX domain-containing protein [Lysinibacillus sp. 2017]TGN35460.1 NUDIX domain-containing protein [Lysinibacillus sp. S2017]
MEKWDVYDQDRKKLDKQITRGDAMEPNDFHVVVHVCIFNSKGEMLIQQRQPFKHGWSNLWDLTCGGSAVAGDTSQQAASRELSEELGLQYNFENMRPRFTMNFQNGFDDYYLIDSDVDLNSLTLQQEEVQAVKWATQEEILKMIEDGTFIPYYESIIQFLFEGRRGYGSIRL